MISTPSHYINIFTPSGSKPSSTQYHSVSEEFESSFYISLAFKILTLLLPTHRSFWWLPRALWTGQSPGHGLLGTSRSDPCPLLSTSHRACPPGSVFRRLTCRFGVPALCPQAPVPTPLPAGHSPTGAPLSVTLTMLQEREWGSRGWSRPRSQTSPWDSHQVWVLGFAQERIQERAIVK